MKTLRAAVTLPLMLAWLMLFPAATAQEATEGPSTGSLQQLSQRLEQASDIPEDERASLASDLDSASAALASARETAARARELASRIERSEEETARFESMIKSASQDPVKEPDADATAEELESEIQLIVADRRSATARRAAVDAELTSARQQRVAERERLADIQVQLEALPTPSAFTGDASIQERISDALTEAQRAQLTAEIDLLTRRMRGQPALESILTAERNWLDVRINRQDRRLELLSEALRKASQSEAQKQIEAARRIAESVGAEHPRLAQLAAENLALAEKQESLSVELDAARREIRELRETYEALERDASLSQRRLAVSGLQSELADVMLTRLRTLPGQRLVSSRIAQRNSRINSVTVVGIDYDESLRALSDRGAFLQSRVPDHAEWDAEKRARLNSLMDQRQRLLRDNSQAAAQLQQILIDTNEVAGNLFTSIRNYEEFLTSNLLWTRNHSYMDPLRLTEQLRLLIAMDGLLQLRSNLPEAALKAQPLLLTFLVGLGLVFRRKIKKKINEQLGKPVRPRDERSDRIFSGIALSLAYTLPVPLIVLISSLVIGNAAGTSVQLGGIAEGLRLTAFLLFAFGFLRHISGRLGVGRRRLKWNGQKMDCLRPALRWLAPVVVTGGFFASFGLSTSPTDSGGPLTAIATLAITAGLFLCSLRALRSDLFDADRISLYGFRLILIMTGAIAVMHLSGHLFAAHLYLNSLGLSIVATLIILFVANILHRVGLIFNAHIERRTREESRAKEDTGEAALDNAEDLATVAALSEAKTQMLSLLRVLGLIVALWLIWSPALPALNIFNEIGLWNVVDSTLPDGELRTVSLATLINAIFILVVTLLVTKHLPPLVDVFLMEWTSVTAGSRYAIKMLMQYIIIGTGLTISLSLLGWEWGKVQWLVAALGVGIGFGLQEIVANFISGLILLFERPIRVGDIISAGSGDGTVTQINARATVIEAFDGKELMVPNKELITGVVTNWSLTTSNLRVVITVGVAYGSDVREAMRILIQVAKDNPSVLDEPAPSATFEDFGDNALVLWLRCYAEREFPRVWTELRTEINERFNEAGISISFPQRDVHLDAESPIPVQIMQPVGPSNNPGTTETTGGRQD